MVTVECEEAITASSTRRCTVQADPSMSRSHGDGVDAEVQRVGLYPGVRVCGVCVCVMQWLLSGPVMR